MPLVPQAGSGLAFHLSRLPAGLSWDQASVGTCYACGLPLRGWLLCSLPLQSLEIQMYVKATYVSYHLRAFLTEWLSVSNFNFSVFTTHRVVLLEDCLCVCVPVYVCVLYFVTVC